MFRLMHIVYQRVAKETMALISLFIDTPPPLQSMVTLLELDIYVFPLSVCLYPKEAASNIHPF